MLRLLVIVSLCLGARGASDVGYPAEEHTVTTEDGYILQLVRIPYGKKSEDSGRARKVVFLMHGLTLGSNSFTYLGPEYGIAYNFADAGFDVWMGNARGNSYSRRHVSLDPDTDKEKFFDFSYEELALFDLPAMIDYILAKTNQDTLHYVAHSQSATAFLVLNSMNTSYQSKFASANLLTGNGYEKKFPNTKIKLMSYSTDVINSITSLTGFVELKPSSDFTLILAELLVDRKVPRALIAGGSTKQVVHYMQNFRDKAFRRFNYGVFANLRKYGNASPPSYDLSKINVDVTFHYSLGDVTQSETDVLAMVHDMPNATARKIARKDFSHIDYLVSADVKELVTDYIIEYLENS